MKKNTLYTVNKWNKPLFIPDSLKQNIFNGGGIIDFKGAFSSAGLKAGANAAISSLATPVGNMLENAISGGYGSKAGNAISGVGSTLGSAVGTVNPILGAAVTVGSNIIGGLTNAAFGSKVNQKKLNQANSDIAALQNTVSNVDSFDDIQGVGAVENVANTYKGGWFAKGSARKKQRALENKLLEASLFANRSIENNIDNIATDQLDDNLASYFALGGPLGFGAGAVGIMQNDKYISAINQRSAALSRAGIPSPVSFSAKTFGQGGSLEADFLDNFSSDPIGSAIRYRKSLDALDAEREKEAIAAEEAARYEQAKEQTLSQPQSISLSIPDIKLPTKEVLQENPATKTSGNATWDYVEKKLRDSGKFNDIQIEGIKYNLQRESALNHKAVGDGGLAFGLGQWHGSRQPKDKSLSGQTQHLIDTLSNYDGKSHWIGRDNFERFLAARTPEEAHYYIAKGYERPAKRIMDKVKRDSDMSLRKLRADDMDLLARAARNSFAFGGELGTNGTDFTNGLLYIDEGGSHENNPLEGVPLGVDAEGNPNLVEEGETVYNDYVFSDRIKVPEFMYKQLGISGKKDVTFAEASKYLAKESEQRPNDPISQEGLKASLAKLAEAQEAVKSKQEADNAENTFACGGKKNKYDGLTSKTQKINRSSDNPYGSILPPELTTEGLRESVVPQSLITDDIRQKIAMDGYTPEIRNNDAAAIDVLTRAIEGRESGPKKYQTWMRYAPALGAGAMAITDALGITNKPDYTYANKLEKVADQVGNYPEATYEPIGDYMRYSPFDRLFFANQLQANSRATDRAILNSGVNQGARNAALLASGYNTTNALGNLYRQGQEYNRNMYERTKEFNRRTNMFNSQMALEAAIANAKYRQQAQQTGLSGLAQAAALRDSIDQRVGSARAYNLSNLLTSLGNIGRENFAMNQINRDRSRHYYGDLTGDSFYKTKNKKGK